MHKNDVFNIEITGMTDDGSGVGRVDGVAVFVPYTVVGETVSAVIIKVNKSYAVGKLKEVIIPSKHRIEPECPHFRKCGGCSLQHMDYEAELAYKQNKVEECIRRIGDCSVQVSPIVPSRSTSRYRNKAQLPVSPDGIGFYRKNSHDVIDMEDCLLQDERVGKIAAAVRSWMSDCNVAPYNEVNGRGIVRHVYTRTGGGRIMVVIVAAADIPHKDELISYILDTDSAVSGIVLNINGKAGNTVLGKENITLWGEGFITDEIGRVSFDISPNSFYQVNSEQTEVLYSIAKRMAGLTGVETVWDLYCGIGTIGQFMADGAARIVGVEIVPQAVEDARKNAEKNGVLNSEYYCGAAEELAAELIEKGLKPDVVILDPPRKGCHTALLDAVCDAAPNKIVYISCKPSTLARDLKYLSERNYTPVEIIPVDMFPKTPHVETVALLSQREKTNK